MEANGVIRGIRWGEAAGLLALVAVVWVFWETPVVYPLKVLVIFFHEASHGLAAILTGGSIERIEVYADEGGVCITRGGSRFLTLSAGYLGSLAAGGALLVLAARTHLDRTVAGAMGVILVLVTLIWVRPLTGFGYLFGLASGAALASAGLYLKREVNDFLLKLIGLTSCLYAVLDIRSDILQRPSSPSDARMLAELTGVPTLIWGLAWGALALAGAAFFLFLACRGLRNGEPAPLRARTPPRGGG